MAEKNYVVNVKTKVGTIFTVRADSAEELVSNITDTIVNSAHDAVAALEELLLQGTPARPLSGLPAVEVTPAIAQTYANAVDTVTSALGGVVISTTSTAPAFAPVPPPAVAPTAVGARLCSHGPMIGRKGQGAKGEWKGLFCPTPKGTAGQCDPIWLNRSMPEWTSV